MSTQISASRKRYIDAETLLEAIEAIKPGAGEVGAIDFQPVLTPIAQLEGKVLLALSQLDARLTVIDRDNDAVVQEMQAKIVALMGVTEQLQLAFATFATQQQQFVAAAENAAVMTAAADASAENLRQANLLLASNAKTDAATIERLQQNVSAKEQDLVAAHAAAVQAQADRDALQLQVSHAQAAIQAILDGQAPPSNPASPASA